MYVETSTVLLISELEDGVDMYDAHFDSEIFVKSPILCVLADNPRASEFEHHLGSCANKFCRKCNVRITILCLNALILIYLKRDLKLINLQFSS